MKQTTNDPRSAVRHRQTAAASKSAALEELKKSGTVILSQATEAADCRDGVLTVHLPKETKPAGKAVDVKGG